MNIALLTLLIFAIMMVAWNFVPAFRLWLRGKSTILETVIGTALYYTGVIGEAFQQLVADGYVPEDWKSYVPFVIAAYYIAKRIQTKDPVGG